MHVRHPIWLRRLGAPDAGAFAILFALESFARALLATVIPLEALALLGDAQKVSILFFAARCVGLTGSFAVPWLVRRTARRWVYTLAALLLIAASALLALGTLPDQAVGMALRVLGVVGMTICVNLYIMDHISRRDLGRVEPKRMFYSAAAWTIGPTLGVYLGGHVAAWAPYAASAAFGGVMLGYFWFLRMTDRPELARTAAKVPRPHENIRRFFAQPRLVLAWLIAVGRNSWWAMFFIYTPIYAVQSGLGELAGGLIVSVGAGFLFLMPLWGWAARRFGARRVLIAGFSGSGVATCLAAFASGMPWLAAALLIVAALCMVVLDALGNVPFMLAVRPRQRPEMTAVYATYRDVADIAPPGVFSLLLKLFELPVVFVASGVAMLALASLSRRVHPRLGLFRKPAPASGGARLADRADLHPSN
ncbi:MAG: MFS transporter [Alphaproteobacteria bacterium]